MSNYLRTKSLFILLIAEGILASCSTDNDGSNTTSTTDSNAACASSCIEAFVAQNYPASVCPDNQDLRCLCTKSNPSGLTVGEALLQCVLANCTGISTEQLGHLYSICSGIPGALPETHSTLTATVEVTNMSTDLPPAFATDSAPPATSTLPPSIPSPSSTDIVSSIVVASSTSPAALSSDDTTLVTSTTSTASSRQTLGVGHTTPDPQTSSSATAIADSSAKQSLSSGTIAGIAVGGVATAFAVFGLLFMFCCLRKRRKSKRGSDQWGSDSRRSKDKRRSVPSSFFGASPADPSAAVKAVSHAPYIPPAGGSQRRSFWRRSIKPEEIGVAVSPELPQKESPANSVHSHASASALLPDKPNWVSSKPSKSRSPDRIASTESTGTIFDEDINGLGLTAPSTTMRSGQPNPPPPRFNLRPLQPHRPPRLVLTQSGHGLPSDPRAQMYAMERQQRATGYTTQPRVPITPVYDNGNAPALLNAWTASAPQARPQLPPGPMRDPRVRLAPVAEKQRSNSSVYDSNASLPPSEPRGHESFSNQPRSSEAPRRLPSQSFTRYSTNPNPAVRSSTASSTTTFEDDDDYYSSMPAAPAAAQTNPPKPTIRHLSSHQSRPITLSPVIESPNRNRAPQFQPRPPAFVTYPPVPRTASVTNQAERLPLPRAGRYIDTRGPPPHPPTSFRAENPNTLTSASDKIGPSSSLAVNPPSSSSVRLVPSDSATEDTNNSFPSSRQGQEHGRSASPSETSSALLARRRVARSAALRAEDEAMRRRKEAEGRQALNEEANNIPMFLQSEEQVQQQGQGQGQKKWQMRNSNYAGEEWGPSGGEGKENEDERIFNPSANGGGQGHRRKEDEWRRQDMDMTPTSGRGGNLVLRVE